LTSIPAEERYKWIRGTDVPAIEGVSRFSTKFETYHHKRQTIKDIDLEGSERVDAGRFMEPAIAAWAAHKWGMKMRQVRRDVVHPTIKMFGCSLDWEEQAGALVPVEIKNSDFIQFKNHYIVSEDNPDMLEDAPMDYLLQVLSQLACLPSAPYAWLVVCVGGNSLKRMKVERNEGAIKRIERDVMQFQKDIAFGTEPKPDFQADAAVLSEIYASVDKTKIMDMTDNNHLPELCQAYLDGAALEKAGDAAKVAAWSEILTIMEDHGKGEVPEKLKAFLGEYTISSWYVKEKFIEANTNKESTKKGFRSKRITKKEPKDGEKS
jgi:predicted phage-related endonuclease